MFDAEATFARKTGSSSAGVDPSISVKRKVTVPVGRLGKAASIGPGWAASNHTRRSAVTAFPPRPAGPNRTQRSTGKCPAFLTILTLHAIITPKGEEATAVRRAH
jgi:hypothetical protein